MIRGLLSENSRKARPALFCSIMLAQYCYLRSSSGGGGNFWRSWVSVNRLCTFLLGLLTIQLTFIACPESMLYSLEGHKGKKGLHHKCQLLSQSRASCRCLTRSIADSFSEPFDVDWGFCWAACAATWACRPKLSSVVGLKDGFVVVFFLSCLMCHVLTCLLCLKASASTCNARSEGILNKSAPSLRQVYSGIVIWGSP